MTHRTGRKRQTLKNLIVIPAYNEEEALPRTLAALGELPPEYEVVIVNDGSRDRTASRGRALAATVGCPSTSSTCP